MPEGLLWEQDPLTPAVRLYHHETALFNLSFTADLLLPATPDDTPALSFVLSSGDLLEQTGVTVSDLLNMRDRLPSFARWLTDCARVIDWTKKAFPGLPTTDGTEAEKCS